MQFKDVYGRTTTDSNERNAANGFNPTVDGLVELFNSLPKQNEMGELSVYLEKGTNRIEVISEKGIRAYAKHGFKPVANNSGTNYLINYGKINK